MTTMALVHSPGKGKNNSIGVADAKQETSSRPQDDLHPAFLNLPTTVSKDDLEELRNRYAAFIIQIDRLRPALARADSSARPEGGGWSVREMLGHLIDADQDVWWPRIEAALSNEHPHFENVDQNELVRTHDWHSQPVEDILLKLVRARWHFGMKLNSIPENEFERKGQHEALGEISILRMLHIMVAHDEYYLTKLRSMLDSATPAETR